MNSIRNAVKSGTSKIVSKQKIQNKDNSSKPKISPSSDKSAVVQKKSTDVAVGVPVVAKGEPALVANGVPAPIGEDKPQPNSSSSDAVNDYILHLNAPKKGMFRGVKKFFSSLLGTRQHKKKKAFEALLEDYQRRHKQPISGNFGGAQQSIKQSCFIPEKPPKISQDDDSAKGGLRRRKRASFIRLAKQKLRALRKRIRLARRGGGKDGASVKTTGGKRKVSLKAITAKRLLLQKDIDGLASNKSKSSSTLQTNKKDNNSSSYAQEKIPFFVEKKPGEHRPEHAVKLNPDKLVSLSDEAKTPGMYVAHNCDTGEVGIAFKDKTSDEVRFSSLKDSSHADPMHMIYTGQKKGEGADAVEEKFSLMMPDENSPDKTASTLSGPGGLNIKIKLPQKDDEGDVFFDAPETPETSMPKRKSGVHRAEHAMPVKSEDITAFSDDSLIKGISIAQKNDNGQFGVVFKNDETGDLTFSPFEKRVNVVHQSGGRKAGGKTLTLTFEAGDIAGREASVKILPSGKPSIEIPLTKQTEKQEQKSEAAKEPPQYKSHKASQATPIESKDFEQISDPKLMKGAFIAVDKRNDNQMIVVFENDKDGSFVSSPMDTGIDNFVAVEYENNGKAKNAAFRARLARDKKDDNLSLVIQVMQKGGKGNYTEIPLAFADDKKLSDKPHIDAGEDEFFDAQEEFDDDIQRRQERDKSSKNKSPTLESNPSQIKKTSHKETPKKIVERLHSAKDKDNSDWTIGVPK